MQNHKKMNLLEKTLIVAKKGFDNLTFGDGILQQQEYHKDAADFYSPKLEWAVIRETAKQWAVCSGLETAAYIFTANYVIAHQQFMGPGEKELAILAVPIFEALRYKFRWAYFANARKKFDDQIATYVPLPKIVLELQDEAQRKHDSDGNNGNNSYLRPADWWKKC